MEYKDIANISNLKEYSLSKNENFLNEDRMLEKETILFKGFKKFSNKTFFKVREKEHDNKIIFRLCSMNKNGEITIENNFKTKAEVQKMFNSLKQQK